MFTCDFERHSLCEMKQGYDDVESYKWLVGSGTSTWHTGPLSGYGGSTSYLYMDASTYGLDFVRLVLLLHFTFLNVYIQNKSK